MVKMVNLTTLVDAIEAAKLQGKEPKSHAKDSQDNYYYSLWPKDSFQTTK